MEDDTKDTDVRGGMVEPANSHRAEPAVPMWVAILVAIGALVIMAIVGWTVEGAQNRIINFTAPLVPALVVAGTAVLNFKNQGGKLAFSFGGSIAVFFAGFLLLERSTERGLEQQAKARPRLALYRLVWSNSKPASIHDVHRVYAKNQGAAPVEWFLNTNRDTLIIHHPPTTDTCIAELDTSIGQATCELTYDPDKEQRLVIDGGDARCQISE